MNWKTAFFASLIALAGALFWGITRTTVNLEQPVCDCHASSDSLKVPPEKAKSEIRLFDEFHDNIAVTPDVDTIVYKGDKIPLQPLANQLGQLRGFSVPHCEVADMLSKIDCETQVWAMFCVKQKEENEQDWEIDLLFQIQKPKKNMELPEEDDFFDFTQPCPTTCPQ